MVTKPFGEKKHIVETIAITIGKLCFLLTTSGLNSHLAGFRCNRTISQPTTFISNAGCDQKWNNLFRLASNYSKLSGVNLLLSIKQFMTHSL